MAAKKGIEQRKRLAAIFVSFTILMVGTVSLSETMSIDYYSVVDTLQKMLPASIVMGCLGWFMGMILDKPRTAKRIGYNNIFMNEIMKNELTKDASTEAESSDMAEESKPAE